ncbi:DUF3237 domain-containing protein [Pararhodobacter marinus]|uniref:DUF3237 domain-containing protein n=1 Tax=Pararhodobacter marinus TaxID=2184063 RepID=A0A2U2C6W2_9RHOB|nr:DUF3237 domain-containing protein [Pararhodobacter marinus]PWE27592.1 DUF3237 domain-containing protein [Pararhodobacter marinus]
MLSAAQTIEILAEFPPSAPGAHLLWEAVVDIGEREDLGAGPCGARGIVPILGGQFRGGPGMGGDQADFHGVVEAGGADRQLLRPDGAKELDALYEMRVADGALLTIRNRVIIDETVEGPRYAMSRIEVTAPQGRWDWLNRRLIVGTLQGLRPRHAAVLIRGWLLTIG